MDRTTLRMNHSAAVFPSFVTASDKHDDDLIPESWHRDGGSERLGLPVGVLSWTRTRRPGPSSHRDAGGISTSYCQWPPPYPEYLWSRQRHLHNLLVLQPVSLKHTDHKPILKPPLPVCQSFTAREMPVSSMLQVPAKGTRNNARVVFRATLTHNLKAVA